MRAFAIFLKTQRVKTGEEWIDPSESPLPGGRPRRNCPRHAAVRARAPEPTPLSRIGLRSFRGVDRKAESEVRNGSD